MHGSSSIIKGYPLECYQNRVDASAAAKRGGGGGSLTCPAACGIKLIQQTQPIERERQQGLPRRRLPTAGVGPGPPTLLTLVPKWAIARHR